MSCLLKYFLCLNISACTCFRKLSACSNIPGLRGDTVGNIFSYHQSQTTVHQVYQNNITNYHSCMHYIPANMRRSVNIDLMLGQCHRWWASLQTALVQPPLFVEIKLCIDVIIFDK